MFWLTNHVDQNICLCVSIFLQDTASGDALQHVGCFVFCWVCHPQRGGHPPASLRSLTCHPNVKPEGLQRCSPKRAFSEMKRTDACKRCWSLLIADGFIFFALLNVYIIYTYYILYIIRFYTSGMEISHVEMRYNHWNFLNVVSFFPSFQSTDGILILTDYMICLEGQNWRRGVG